MTNAQARVEHRREKDRERRLRAKLRNQGGAGVANTGPAEPPIHPTPHPQVNILPSSKPVAPKAELSIAESITRNEGEIEVTFEGACFNKRFIWVKPGLALKEMCLLRPGLDSAKPGQKLAAVRGPDGRLTLRGHYAWNGRRLDQAEKPPAPKEDITDTLTIVEAMPAPADVVRTP